VRRKRPGLNAGAFLPFAFPSLCRKVGILADIECSPTMTPSTVDTRLRPRFKLKVDIRIHSRTCGVLKGRTVDISESAIPAMLRLEVPLGEVVNLDFTLPLGDVTIYANGRQRNTFRFGFEFIESNHVHEIIRHTCRDLAVDQALIAIHGCPLPVSLRDAHFASSNGRRCNKT